MGWKESLPENSLYLESDRGILYNSDVLSILKALPDNSVDCIVTSPPYWQKRDYGDSAFTTFEGNPDCEHEWVEQEIGLQHENRNNIRGKQEEVVGRRGTTWIRKYDRQIASVCKKCGAWYGQLGLEPTPQMFVKHLADIFREAKRVLKPTGNLFVNIDDTWVGGRYEDDTSKYAGGTNLSKPNWSAKGIPKRKSLALVPELFAVKMVYEEGWILREKIIWSKKVFFYKENRTRGNAMPESVKDRLAHSWEYVFHFTKRQKYYFNLGSMRVEPQYDNIHSARMQELIQSESGHHSSSYMQDITRNSKYLNNNGGTRSPGGRLIRMLVNGEADKLTLVKKAIGDVNAYLKRKLKESRQTVKSLSRLANIPESQLAHYFRTDMSGASIPSRDVWNILKPILGLGNYEDFVKEEYKSLLPSVNPLGANPGNVIQINVRGFSEAHFAVFPEDLPKMLITLGCPEDGIVLDPFAGAGTTLLVADKLRRKWVGIELNPEYCEIINKRLKSRLRRKVLL